MDGAKLVADTADISNDCGRLAFWLGGSTSEKMYGPTWKADPGGSRNIAV